jgi:hypothetical protein
VTGFRPARFLALGRGREAVITLWLAGVLADGVRATPPWKAFYAGTQPARQAMGTLGPLDVGEVTFLTVEILVTWAMFALFFWVFVYVAARLARVAVAEIARLVSPSLIPIALAYLLAHNLTQLVILGPLLVTARDADLAQVRELVIRAQAGVSPAWVWWTQVSAIVAGHILAVIMAHARLSAGLRESERTADGQSGTASDAALRADLGWLSAMLIYTATSLWILYQPISPEG